MTKHRTPSVLAILLATGALLGPVAVQAAFVDEYKNNTSSNTTPATNPVIRLLNGYAQLWIPGPTWDTGTPTAVGAPVLAYNIEYVVNLTRHRTDAQAEAAYFDDRRNQSYSVIDGLGPLTADYYVGSGATTIITSIPPDATTVLYNDGGTGPGLTSSALGNVVTLVNTLRGPYSSTTPRGKTARRVRRRVRSPHQRRVRNHQLRASRGDFRRVRCGRAARGVRGEDQVHGPWRAPEGHRA